MGHTHLSFVVEITTKQTTKSFIMYKLFVLAAVLATVAAESDPAAYYAGYAALYGHGLAGLGYAGYGGYGYGGYAAPAYAGYAAAPLAAAPVVAAPIVAPAPVNYA